MHPYPRWTSNQWDDFAFRITCTSACDCLSKAFNQSSLIFFFTLYQQHPNILSKIVLYRRIVWRFHWCGNLYAKQTNQIRKGKGERHKIHKNKKQYSPESRIRTKIRPKIVHICILFLEFSIWFEPLLCSFSVVVFFFLFLISIANLRHFCVMFKLFSKYFVHQATVSVWVPIDCEHIENSTMLNFKLSLQLQFWIVCEWLKTWCKICVDFW